MNKESLVSIIIPVYNVKKYLPECLDSVLNQSYKNLEIILVDDGSTDGSEKIVDEYKKKDQRIVVVHQKNQGLSAARNTGIKKSSGEFIAFIDSDDFIDKNFIKKLFKNLTKNNSAISVCGFESFPIGPSESPDTSVLSGKDAAIKLLTEQKNYQIVSWNKLYKKSLFNKIIFPVGKKHEDSLTTYKLFANADKISFFKEELYFYRQRSGSTMNKVNLEERLDTKLLAATEAKEYFKNDEKLKQAAEISELLAYFAYLDNIISGKLDMPPGKILNWLKKNKRKILENPFLTNKLKIYMTMVTKSDGLPYKTFRKIIH